MLKISILFNLLFHFHTPLLLHRKDTNRTVEIYVKQEIKRTSNSLRNQQHIQKYIRYNIILV